LIKPTADKIILIGIFFPIDNSCAIIGETIHHYHNMPNINEINNIEYAAKLGKRFSLLLQEILDIIS